MSKSVQVIILSIILCIIFFSILISLLFLVRKRACKKHLEFEKLLNNVETKNNALLILNKRENIYRKIFILLKYYFLVLGILFILLGVYLFHYSNFNSIEIMKSIVIIITGFYFLFIGLKDIITEIIYKKCLVNDGEEINVELTNENKILFGKIKIINSNKYTVYVSWNIYDDKNNNICYVASNIFQKNEERTKNKLLEKIIEKIRKYRIGRKKYFKDYIIKIL